MRLRNIRGAEESIALSRFVIHGPHLRRGCWQQVFGNEQPLFVEIGMGKGKFLYTMAKEHPDCNFIGIEKYSSVLFRAIQKMEEEERPNLRFIRMDAEAITDVFAPGEIAGIYLNFSDPWPKDRHAGRRLPSARFLERYDRILQKDGRIEFKTDNRPLFDFALEELEGSVFKTDAVTFDLHREPEMNAGNIMTEYEERFSAKGNPICKYIISRG